MNGATVQLTVQDPLSGLLVTTRTLPGTAGLAPGGFWLKYSTNSAQGWIDGSVSTSLLHGLNFTLSFAELNGKLYAGTGGSSAGHNRVYACDPGADD